MYCKRVYSVGVEEQKKHCLQHINSRENRRRCIDDFIAELRSGVTGNVALSHGALQIYDQDVEVSLEDE